MDKERTIIVGAGGFGRELINWSRDCHDAGRLPPLAGMLDDNPAALKGFDYGVDILGTASDFVPEQGDMFILAIGTPAAKERIVAMLRERGAQFATLIHPAAVVARSARIGEGCVLCPMSLVSADAQIGRFVSINALSSVGHDVRLGDYATLSAHVDLTGSVSVGHSVLIGSGAKILPRVMIGDNATIGAGSIVYRTVPAGHSVFAQPAKMLRRS